MSSKVNYFEGRPYENARISHNTKQGKKHYIVRRFLKERTCETCKFKYLSHRNNSRFCSRKCILWKGGKTNRSNGYIWIKDWSHPSANSQGYVYLHRYVMEKHLGRMLKSWEVVHHIDENKKNNNIENLVVMSEADHSRMHLLRNNYNRKYIKTKFHHIDGDNCAHWKELLPEALKKI